MRRNAKNGLRLEQELDFGFPLWCGFIKLGEGEVVAVYRLTNTYIPTRLKPERHRLSWRDHNCSAPFQVISSFSFNLIICSPLKLTSHQRLCISHSVSVTEASEVFVVKLLIWFPNVCWTVHHCNSWGMKNQLDVTCYFISLIMRSTCFGY